MTIAESVDKEIEGFMNDFILSNGARRRLNINKKCSIKYMVGKALLIWKEVSEDYPNLEW